ncbi:MAG: sporulation membrane protein YtaF [Syntrophomonas sp.]
MWVALLTGLALSMDGFTAGIAYGCRKIHLPLASSLVITLASLSAVSVSMLCGKGLSAVLPAGMAIKLGAFLLIGLGFYNFMQACRERINKLPFSEEEPLLTLSIKTLGIIVQILKEPASADFDLSGEIGLREAFFLGLALALDAFGAGIGLAMTGLNILYTALSVGVVQLVLVNAGIYLGRFLRAERYQRIAAVAPGFILIGIGIFKLM